MARILDDNNENVFPPQVELATQVHYFTHFSNTNKAKTTLFYPKYWPTKIQYFDSASLRLYELVGYYYYVDTLGISLCVVLQYSLTLCMHACYIRQQTDIICCNTHSQLYRTIVNNLYSFLNLYISLQDRIIIDQIIIDQLKGAVHPLVLTNQGLVTPYPV